MQDCYADIIVNISSEKLDHVFQYRIPEEMRDKLQPGMVVRVPFGKGSRMIQGYCIGTGNRTDFEEDRLKDISAIVTDGLGEEARLVRLAMWMKERYGSTAIAALKTVIPVRRKIKSREKKTVRLLLSGEDAQEQLRIYTKKHQTARKRLMEALIDEPELPWDLVSEKLNITGSVVKTMQEAGVLEMRRTAVYRNPVRLQEGKDHHVALNAEQQEAADAMIGDWDRDDTPYHRRYLLHGVTGSGKTEVYMKIIAYAQARGQQAIVLIPEIALTYQTLLRFFRRFGDQVSVINSRLSAGERYDQFERARNGDISIMIGPRSALFTPFPNLGVIVIDEEHEPAYISETSPRYHAVETAFERASMENAAVVLGSATPSLETYYSARQGEIRLFTLNRRAGGAAMPRTQIVDMRRELREGNKSVFSRALTDAMQETLLRREQIMLFLNRRGYAGILSCRSCGHVIKCPHCSVALSLHGHGKMVCHYCGYTAPAPAVCPQCGSSWLKPLRAGTEQIEQEVKKMFPEARVLRMDLDTTRQKDAHAAILSAFSGHEADILIGTQMIVKGHDFPDVTLMGILAADLSLNAPDYRAAERTFQLLTQAAGRSGRGRSQGQVVIQTYDPDNYVIQAAARQDYAYFYEKEIDFRRLGGYPPCGAMYAIHMSGPDEKYLEKASGYLQKFALRLAAASHAQVLGPADEPVAKIQDIYRRVLYIRHDDLRVLSRMRRGIEQYIDINEGFRTIGITFEKC